MDIIPLLNASLMIQIHVFCALLSMILVPVMLLRRKGDRLHKLIGRIWVLAMGLTALSSFAITEIRIVGPFSPIHGLSILTLYSLVAAILTARQGRIEAHKGHMLGAMTGLVGAGVFTFLPGRLMSTTFFQGMEVAGFVGMLVLGAIGLIAWRIKLRSAVSIGTS